MALLATTQITKAGALKTLTAAAGGGDTFQGGEHVEFEALNGSGSTITITFVRVTAGPDGQNEDLVKTIVAGARMSWAGPFGQAFANATDGYVHVTYSGVTTLTVGAFSV